jgi:malonyl-CoA/methylmalonyl-CoA synthetase
MTNPLYDTLFGAHADRDAPFLHLPGGTALSYAAFLGMAAQIAHTLTHAGVVAGDRVAVQIEKSPEALAIYAACAQTGAVCLPLNTGYTGAEVAYFLDNSGARLFVCDPLRHAELAPVAAQAGARIETLDAAGAGSLMDMAQGQPDRFATVTRTQDDLAAFLYTSGTTGRSKGAMLTQANLLSNARALTDLWQFTATDTLLHALPIFHTHGLFVATNITLLAGGSMILLPRFDVDSVFAHLPRATAMMGVPTFYTRLLDDPRLTAAATAHMRLFVSGSAPMLLDTHLAWHARTGTTVLERYGMTETNMSCSNPYTGERRAGTVGPALPGVEVKVCDDAGTQVAHGTIGTLEVRGPNVFKGYWQMPDKTAAELRADGFFITGDLAVMDADGYVTIVGRGKDMIIAGGFNIYPKEIEELLDAQEGVLESAVIGVPHPDLGEGVVAILAREAGAVPDTEAILAAIAPDLARFKQPRRVIVVDALPRNTMGKVQKAALRATYADMFKAP